MKFEGLKQFLRETEVGTSARLKKIAHRRNRAISTEVEISQLVVALQTAIRTPVAYKTDEHNSDRQSIESTIHMAQKKC